MLFTTIVNPSHPREVHAMPSRTLEKLPATTKKTPPKAPKETAMLVIANGEPVSEAARLGFTLVGAGLTAGAIGLLEGLARRGKFDWWARLSARARGMVMVAFTIVAGFHARRWRQMGRNRRAAGAEAAAIAAWTLAIVYFTEAGPGASTVHGLGDLSKRAPGDMKLDELAALDSQIDDDIRGAVDRLATLAEEQRRADRGHGDVGALAVEGDSLIEVDDDPDF